MDTIRTATIGLAVAGWLAAGLASADELVSLATDSSIYGRATNYEEAVADSADLLNVRSDTGIRTRSALHTGTPGHLYSQTLGRDAAVYAHAGLGAEAGNGLVPSPLLWSLGVDEMTSGQAHRWPYEQEVKPGAVTVGYAWRKLKVEGSAFSIGNRDEGANGKRDLALLDSTSSRVSYQPSPSWLFRISRGNLSNLDQLEPGEELRRTALSASYTGAFANGNWRTTLAWGRNDRKTTGSTTGYLLESTLRFNDAHALFARLERARSNEEGALSENMQRQIFRMNKLTFGYFYDVSRSGPFRYDVGGLVTRHLASPNSTGPYGSDPTTGMMFVRLWLP